MSDIVTELNDCAQAGSAASGETELVVWRAQAVALMRDAALAILGHRAIAGAVSPGETLAEIKDMLRTPDGLARLKATVGGDAQHG